MKKHVNIPIFIPHLGCPNMCVFCNQRTISGVSEFKVESVRREIEGALATVDKSQSAEIAFFGGSFTGIDRALMTELLKIANEYVLSGRAVAVRCSTRPDYINEEILEILKRYNVKTIELGLQSVNEDVLSLCKRGHSANDAVKACKLIKDYGFSLVGQMMIGLPGSTLKNELETAEFIIKNGAESARIYPTVVFRDTELCEMVSLGTYRALTLEEAVSRSATVMRRFIDAGVEVIRIGLCASDNLLSEKTYFSGPNHPALGELVIGEIYYQLIKDQLGEEPGLVKSVIIYVNSGAVSKAIGQRKINLKRLSETYRGVRFSFIPCKELSQYQVRVERREEG